MYLGSRGPERLSEQTARLMKNVDQELGVSESSCFGLSGGFAWKVGAGPRPRVLEVFQDEDAAGWCRDRQKHFSGAVLEGVRRPLGCRRPIENIRD